MGDLTRGQRNIAWIQAMCYVPEGKDVSKPIILRDWQQAILLGIYDNPHGTRRALISFGRKSGKSSLSAMILLLHLIGPESQPNSQIFSCAQSREQASVLFSLAHKMIRMNPALSRYILVRDTAKQLLCPELGTSYRALSADASTAMGLSPILCLHDEIGQVRGPRSPLFAAMESAASAHEHPLTVCLSTQAPSDSDLFSLLIDDAKTGADPRVKLFLYTAEGYDPYSDAGLKAANPAFGDFANATEMRAMAQDAKRMPSREAEYLNLICNLRVEAVNPFISKSVWDANGQAVAESFAGYPVYIGLDLASVSDLAALVAIAPIDGVWHVQTTCFLPEEGLVQKAAKDRVPWDLWVKQGYLTTTPGKAIEYAYIAEHLRELFERWDVRAVAFDRWGMRFLTPWLREAGFNDYQLNKFIDFGQGFQSMSPALRELETALLNEKLAHGNHPVLAFNAASAVVVSDPSGNRKLSKEKSRGKIDAMVCLAMALSVATTQAAIAKTSVSIFDDAELFPELHG